MASYITVVEIAWDGGTEYYSFQGVSASSQYYEDRLLKIGKITREVSLTPGNYIVADSFIELDNSDNYFGSLKYSESFKGREVTIKVVDADTGDSFTTLWTALIYNWQISKYALRLSIRDHSYDKLNGQIETGGSFNTTDFSDFPPCAKPGIVPAAYGILTSNTEKGAIAGQLVTTSNPFTYIFSHPRINSIDTVYVYGVEQTGGGVDYTATTAAFNGHTYDVVEFTTDQRDTDKPDQTEVTADIQGHDTGTLYKDPLGQLYLIMVLFKVEDAVSFPTIPPTTDTATKHTNKEIYGCMLVQEGDTAFDVLNKYAQSFNMYPFRNTAGKLAIYGFDIIDEVDATAEATLTDENDIIANSLNIQSLDRPISRLQANYRYNWIPEKEYFEFQPKANDVIAEDEIVNAHKESFNQYCVYDATTSEFIRRERRYLLSEGTHFVTFDLPIKNYTLDLNDWVELTAKQGVGTDGYDDKMMRIIRMDYYLQPSNMKVTARCVVLPPVMGSDFCGCVLNCRADRLTASDGDTVQTWTDESENDNDPTQATAAHRPTYRASGANSQPYMEFDGTTDHYTISNNILGTGSYMVTVVGRSACSGTDVFFAESDTGTISKALYCSGTTLRWTVDGDSTYDTATLTANTDYIISAIWDGTNSKLYVNGTQEDTSTPTEDTNEYTPAIGALDNDTNHLSGRIYEVIVLARDVDILDAERRTIENMLSERYDIALS